MGGNKLLQAPRDRWVHVLSSNDLGKIERTFGKNRSPGDEVGHLINEAINTLKLAAVSEPELSAEWIMTEVSSVRII